MRSWVVGTGLLLASGLGLVMCGGIGSGEAADAGATLSDGTIESGAGDSAPPGDGGVVDAPQTVSDASDCNPPCANGLACTEGICMGCAGPSVILAEATGDPKVGDFANSVAISGSTLLVGADYSDMGAGAVYVFKQSGSEWSYVTTLPRPAGVTNFGSRVVMSGPVALVSARQAGGPVALLYNQTGSTWTLGQVLTPPPDAGAYYLPELAIDGTTAIVAGASLPLSAMVYVQSGSSWMPQATLTPAENFAGGVSGGVVQSVALSGDTAVLVFEWNNLIGNATSFDAVFVRAGTTWTEQASLAPILAAQETLSFVGVANDMAVLTSNTFNCSSPTCAGVENGWVYVRSGTTWTQQKTKSPVPDGGPIEGNLALEDLPDPVAVSPGSVLVGRRLFALTSTSWQSVTLPPFDAGGGNLSVGASVARSGSTVVIGAPTNGNPLTAGAVLVYSCSP